jgi:hypothetical protein
MKTRARVRHTIRRNVSSHLLDPLESRWLLSASMTASVSNGLLSIQGNNSNTSVIIDQAALGTTQFRVSSGDGTTKINGQTAPLIFSGVNGIAITIGSGNDTVVIQNATVVNNVQVTGAAGNQLITLNGVTLGGNFTLSNSGGQNSTTVENSSINGNVTVNAGVGFNSGCGAFWSCNAFSSANETFTLSASTVGNNLNVSNVSGETTTDIENSSIGNNVTVSNGAASYGNCSFNYGFFCGSKCGGATSELVGDLFTLNGSTVGNNVAVSNASDGNATSITNSSINGTLAVSNVVGTGNQCNFGACWSGNIADASDAFALIGSTVGSDVTLANISDGATTDIESSTLLGGLSVNNGVGSYGQGFTSCGGQTSSTFGDLLTLSQSTVINSVAISNGSTYNSTDVESSAVLGAMAVNNGLNLVGQSSNNACGNNACGQNSCGNSGGSNSCGNSTKYVYTTDLFTLNGSVVGTNLAVTNASGYTNTAVENSTIVNNVTVIDALGVSYFEMDFSTIGSNLSFTAGAGTTTVNVTNSLIANNATINVSIGASVVISPSQVLAQLTVTV